MLNVSGVRLDVVACQGATRRGQVDRLPRLHRHGPHRPQWPQATEARRGARLGERSIRPRGFAVQLLDGFPNTRAHARGKLPEMISQAGFSAVNVFGRYRTGGGTLDLIEAQR